MQQSSNSMHVVNSVLCCYTFMPSFHTPLVFFLHCCQCKASSLWYLHWIFYLSSCKCGTFGLVSQNYYFFKFTGTLGPGESECVSDGGGKPDTELSCLIAAWLIPCSYRSFYARWPCLGLSKKKNLHFMFIHLAVAFMQRHSKSQQWQMCANLRTEFSPDEQKPKSFHPIPITFVFERFLFQLSSQIVILRISSYSKHS